jgi:hypothetical protein
MVWLLYLDTVLIVSSRAHTVVADRFTEIAHVVARHSAERHSYVKVMIAFVGLIELVGLDFGFSRLISTLLLDLPNSRVQELEGLFNSFVRNALVLSVDTIRLSGQDRPEIVFPGVL